MPRAGFKLVLTAYLDHLTIDIRKRLSDFFMPHLWDLCVDLFFGYVYGFFFNVVSLYSFREFVFMYS